MAIFHLSFLIFHFSSTPAQAQPLGRYSADIVASAVNFADTIDIEWDRQQVYVPLTIDGRSYRFLLDTGAGLTVVFSGTPLADSPRAGGILSHDATGRTDTVTMVQLPPMLIGSVVLEHCHATVQQHAPGSHIDGILGFDLVNSGLSMKIDVPRRQFIITDRRDLFRQETDGAISLRYTLNFHVPYVDITPFGRQRERVLIDTGSRRFFAMNKAHFDAATADEGQSLRGLTIEGRSTGRHAIGLGGMEPEGEVVFMQLDNLQLGDYAFSNLHAITTQGGSHLGAPLLQHGALIFTPRQRRLFFLPQSGQQPCPVDNRQLEIAFVADELGRPQVGLVWEQGEPYQAGLRQGDIIEQIDQRPVLSLQQFIRWPFMPGHPHTFTLRDRQGQRRNVSWVRIPLKSEEQ